MPQPREVVPDTPEFAPELRLLEFFRRRPGASFLQAIDDLGACRVGRYLVAMKRLLARGGLLQLSDAKPFKYVASVRDPPIQPSAARPVPPPRTAPPAISAVRSPPLEEVQVTLRRPPAGEFVTRCRPTGTPIERAG